ncbi:MAG: cohesin domain-containing protein [Bacteroidota bacterium]
MLSKFTLQFIRSVAWLALCTATVSAQGIQWTIADTTGKAGDTLRIPIRVSSMTLSDSVYSGQMTISYDGGVVNIVGVDTAGAILSGFGSITFNATTKTFAFAGTSILTGNGTLLYLRAVVVGNPGNQTTIAKSSASLNEGKPSLTVVNGNFRILAIQINPKTPSTIVVGDSVQFSATGDKKLPLSWSSSDTAVGMVDSTGKFRALAAGQARVRILDAQGLRDSTTLFGVYPLQAKSLTVSVHDTSYTQTLLFNLPVYISNVTGLGIVSSQFALTFNSTHLQAVDVIKTNTKSASWPNPSFNVTSGRVDIALAGADTLSGTGVLVYVRFKVLPSASGSSTITLSGVLFNENLNANTLNGTFTAIVAPTVVVSPSTAILTKGDTLQLKVTSGGHTPFTWSSSAPSVASISNTGLLTALQRGTTTVSVIDSFGFVGTTGTITVNDFRISLPDTAMGLADSIDIPIFADDLTGLGVLSFESRIVYDSSIVRIASVIGAGTLSNGFNISYKDTLDTLRIAAAGSSPVIGGGTLLKIRVKTRSLSTGVSSPLSFAYFRFNEGTPTATTHNGSVAIVAAPLPPTLVSPADSSAGISTSPALTWNASAGATSYRVQVSLVSNFSSLIRDSAGVITTSLSLNGLTNATKYFWRVNAKNVGGTSAFTAARNFTTAGSVPTAPTLVSPANNATGVARNARLVWNRIPDASSYEVQVSTSSIFASTTVDSLGITDSTVIVGPLAANTLHYWRVRATNALGTGPFSTSRSFTTGIQTSVEDQSQVPADFALAQNFPNPFNPSTVISYQLSATSVTSLKVFDLLGREVATLVDGEQAPGYHQVVWSATAGSSGLYFYRLEATGHDGSRFAATRKMLVIK